MHRPAVCAYGREDCAVQLVPAVQRTLASAPRPTQAGWRARASKPDGHRSHAITPTKHPRRRETWIETGHLSPCLHRVFFLMFELCTELCVLTVCVWRKARAWAQVCPCTHMSVMSRSSGLMRTRGVGVKSPKFEPNAPRKRSNVHAHVICSK